MLGLMAHACNFSTWEVEAGVQVQPVTWCVQNKPDHIKSCLHVYTDTHILVSSMNKTMGRC